MFKTTNQKGQEAEAHVLAALTRLGKTVLVPFGVAQYDLVFEDQVDGFQRVQCKAGILRDGVVVFSGRTNNGGRGSRYYPADAFEWFGVYCPQTDQVYLVPRGEVGNEGRLRVAPVKNNQMKGVREASLYVI